jgi:hypothetical protein
MDHISLSRYVTMREMTGTMHYLSKCVGLPLKRAFIVEPPTVMMWLFNIVKMFLKQKMRDRIGFYMTPTELQEYLGPEFVPNLPTVLGGELEDTHMFDWMYQQMLLDSRAGRSNSF